MVRSNTHRCDTGTQRIVILSALLVACGCAIATADAASERGELAAGLDRADEESSFPSTYRPELPEPVAIVNATVLTGTGHELHAATVLMRDGSIEAVGADVTAPAGYKVVDGTGKWVTPGLIDVHSHLGVYSVPSVPAHDDGNEMSDPNTAQVWAEHSVWPHDPAFDAARAGGVTTISILPGSSNLFGGRTVTLKNVRSATVQGMKFPGAPHGLKMACGENPKSVYGNKGRAPSTRMGSMAGYRKAWIDAADYQRKWQRYRARVQAGEDAEPPKRDLQLDTLAGVLEGRIRPQIHCYRSEELANMLDLAAEFDYRIAAFHHASEAYKVLDLLMRADVCVATWAGSWGAKMESFDAIETTIALIDAAGGCAIVHSDDRGLIQRLNREAAAALSAARAAGISISRGAAIRWITANPARALGIEERTGTLQPGKMADVVIWNRDPFSVYALAEQVFIDGVLSYGRDDPAAHPTSDFLLGSPGQRRNGS